MNMTAALETLMKIIREDYSRFMPVSDELEPHKRLVRQEMQDRFKNSLSFTEGKKYIRVVQDGSVWGFIVNIQDDKQFRYGDILKAAGWKTPARNSARGNVFEDYQVSWAGPNYLR
jgi:hypothetical protein